MPDRSPKRQRKKEAAAARREAMREMMERQRKRRMYTLAGVTALLLVGGIGLASLAFFGDDEPEATPAATEAGPTPVPTPPPIACGGQLPQVAGSEKDTYQAPEDQELERNRTYIWRLETSCGTIDVELDVRRAPKTTNSIVFLTRQGFFDGLTFHRIAKGFVIQGGDPSGDGTGGPGYKVEEAPPGDLGYDRGVVAMAKGGQEAPGTSGSQFFVATSDTGLPAEYALVGTVVEGMDVVDEIEALQAENQDAPPPEQVFIEKASIIVR
jgi:peptidyl-prolyl cis-trans isomerase B (cyclophilin B)